LHMTPCVRPYLSGLRLCPRLASRPVARNGNLHLVEKTTRAQNGVQNAPSARKQLQCRRIVQGPATAIDLTNSGICWYYRNGAGNHDRLIPG
jgi:hypothetical protein